MEHEVLLRNAIDIRPETYHKKRVTSLKISDFSEDF